MKLGHVHLKVRDLEASVRFYTELLDLSVTERVGDFAFLTGSASHHTLALQGIGPNAPRSSPSAVGLYHTAWEVETEAEFAEARARAERLAGGAVAVDHGISWAMYFADPDGNGIEIMLDRRTAPGGRPLWGGHQTRLP